MVYADFKKLLLLGIPAPSTSWHRLKGVTKEPVSPYCRNMIQSLSTIVKLCVWCLCVGVCHQIFLDLCKTQALSKMENVILWKDILTNMIDDLRH